MYTTNKKPITDKMNKFICKLFVNVIIFGCCGHSVANNDFLNFSEQGFELICDSNVYDFGKISVDKSNSLLHSFTLINTSKHPIRLLDQSSHSSCGCTSFELPKNSINPGEYTNIDVNVDWSSRSGYQEEVVTIKTDSTKNPEIKLTVRGVVVKRAVLSTHLLDFGQLKPGQQKTHIIQLFQGIDKTPFHILKTDNNSKYISIKPNDSSNGSNSNSFHPSGIGDFAITFTAPEIRGQYNSVVVFYTDIEEQPELKLAIKASSTGHFELKPNTLFFQRCHYNKESLNEVRINSDTLGITSVAINPSNTKDQSPFYIKGVQSKLSDDVLTTVVTVGCTLDDRSAFLYQAILNITFGKEVIGVPIIALSEM